MNKKTDALSHALLHIVWQFGPKGINGECCEDLSMPEFRALQKIAETPACSVQEVGNHLGFTKSGATRIVNRLEKKGYVHKEKSYADARVCCLRPQLQGLEILQSVSKQYEERLALAMEKLGTDASEVELALLRLAKAL